MNQRCELERNCASSTFPYPFPSLLSSSLPTFPRFPSHKHEPGPRPVEAFPYKAYREPVRLVMHHTTKLTKTTSENSNVSRNSVTTTQLLPIAPAEAADKKSNLATISQTSAVAAQNLTTMTIARSSAAAVQKATPRTIARLANKISLHHFRKPSRTSSVQCRSNQMRYQKLLKGKG